MSSRSIAMSGVLAVVVGVSCGQSVAAPAPAGTATPAPAASVPQTPAQKEAMRLLRISEWAQKTKASRRDVEARVFAPIVEGIQSDTEKNRTASSSFAEKATAAGKAGDAQAAKKLRLLSDLFGECVREDRHFLSSYRNGDLKSAKDAILRLRACDERIAEVAGQRVPRSWYVHDVTLATMGMSEDEARRWFEQQFERYPSTVEAKRTPPGTR